MPSRQPQDAVFQETFKRLRDMLKRNAGALDVQLDGHGGYQLCSKTLKDRTGRPLFVAAVKIGKSYVSFHFMPVYANPKLLKDISPSLLKRMQGKSCFNFSSIEPAALEELEALTKKGLREFQNIKLPW